MPLGSAQSTGNYFPERRCKSCVESFPHFRAHLAFPRAPVLQERGLSAFSFSPTPRFYFVLEQGAARRLCQARGLCRAGVCQIWPPRCQELPGQELLLGAAARRRADPQHQQPARHCGQVGCCRQGQPPPRLVAPQRDARGGLQGSLWNPGVALKAQLQPTALPLLLWLP